MKEKFPIYLSVISLIGLAAHFILRLCFSDLSYEIQYAPLFFLIAIAGIPLSIQIIFRLLKGNFGADLLALIALLLAIYLHEFVACGLITLMLASGQALEEYASNKASFVLQALAERMPSIAHIKRGEKIEDAKQEQIKIGDLIVIYPHETCPVDGEVVEGNGGMDESYLTGEPYQIEKTIGSRTLSGAINGTKMLVVRAEKLPKDSRYASIVEVINRAKDDRPQIRKIADKIGAIFTPLALGFALIVLFITSDLTKFLSILTIATPCPLLIAVPIAIISAISICAKRGIIIKDPRILENLPSCSTAIFDKTGTLTCGEPRLTEVICLSNFKESELISMAASLEKYSRHPLGVAIVKEARVRNLELKIVESLEEAPGRGLKGKIEENLILITSRKNIADNFTLPGLKEGLECIIVIDEVPAALMRFSDVARNESKPFISHLGPNHNFNKVILLSGDRDSQVEYLAKTLEINHHYSNQTPEQKLAIVKEENSRAKTMFMGDGINDAPALMAATVGIAFGQNSSVTSEAAGAVILESSLVKVDELLHISERMRTIILQSAIGGMVFSLIGMVLAAFGLISPAAGATFQQVIDVVAIINAVRMARTSEKLNDIAP